MTDAEEGMGFLFNLDPRMSQVGQALCSPQRFGQPRIHLKAAPARHAWFHRCLHLGCSASVTDRPRLHLFTRSTEGTQSSIVDLSLEKHVKIPLKVSVYLADNSYKGILRGESVFPHHAVILNIGFDDPV